MLRDAKTRKLLRLLKKDASQPLRVLAKELNMTEPGVKYRIDSLKEKNVIKKFTIQAQDIYAMLVGIEQNPEHSLKDLKRKLLDLSVDDFYSIAKRYDCIVKISAETEQEIQEKISQIEALKEVSHVELFPILSQK